MKKMLLPVKALFSAAALSMMTFGVSAQTNVFDDIIVPSANHSSLEAAIITANLQGALQDPTASLTVWAPDNQAFDDLATALGTDINGLLALPNLADILTYHVLGTTNNAASLSNGQIETPLNAANTIKITVTGTGDVFANHAQVNAADLPADNGVVHSIDAVILADETVADIAIDNGFSTLVTAVATAELLPAVTDPFATLTVFAPDNTAFDNLATALGVTLNDILALPNLQDILLYHVLGAEVDAASVQNGGIVTALSATNTIKTSVFGGNVYANQAQVQLADLTADNGLVHTLDAVILPNETVVDAAIDNGFTTLTAAVIAAELLPTLSDPSAQYTVFAPTDAAFDTYVMDAGITLNDLLAAPNLADVLLYHTLGSEALSTGLSAGNVTTLEGSDVVVNLTGGVFINDAEVTLADVDVDNGVVHVINKVLDPATASLNENTIEVNLYPNPATEFITVAADKEIESITVVSLSGAVLKTINVTSEEMNIDVTDLASGQYLLVVNTAAGASQATFNVQ
ncbi:fasciclin domain-containing protein [Crocinitomicaceae bacterium]|nr:fasciclin domain-containing protein [Crocinitomicaceae bacterium]